ncbi:MAG: UDP-N-acetylmuramoyl-tripeptide--D-alanyl-D-alanine ligase [Alistipes sp.]|jgi:UDP-N-acetylmuramoyl-tripeptide--D-alanyl-D-alanine ligase|uniref:UDP-N-acetylmuramoyl-tripeptide--D-alanyl-D- alanine ligase n=1 Tax=Alistipes sp. TaxID=1872444 RepID=UPI001DCC1B34|nr:UDP-N-acetylmuramoyl-tripeptide--D-alanyl-D-alanine ligase [Alistipes sp.]MBS6100917.1 UDP-N-acetylmuramoyl-tripeptide--D-alanyl-D-alanine ligase [Alistipes sp.]HJI19437.1 UDP-N-acetylmuramoyl-tripeptide--D-alanyl-D-alanine ligase [Rikenellaceae bacterium]
MSALYDLFRDHPRVTTDSRHIEPGGIFFALKGERFDGNRFAAESLRLGAAFAVADDPALRDDPAAREGRLIVVDDALGALQELAREHRRELGIPVLAVTGSNGKTTTKELLRRVLSERFTVLATGGNLNNHIGVPLTLLSLTREAEFAVVEMGASARGEIALLASIAEPNYGLITNIGRAHLDGFGGPEGVRRGKGELFDFLRDNGGRAFVAAEDATLTAMAREREPMAVEYYSLALADDVPCHLEGEYNRANVAAAVAVGRYFGIAEERILHAVDSYVPTNNRSQRMLTERNTLILDCYNANPSSMQAALDNFLVQQPDAGAGKAVILGDMLELGDWSRDEHRHVVRLAARDTQARILLVGEHFAEACRSLDPLPPNVTCFPTRQELEEHLDRNPLSGSLILVKGSRGIGLEHLTGRL